MANIYTHVNCPIVNGNIRDIAASHEAALRVFTQQCPAGVRVAEIEGIREKKARKCAWKVKYVRDYSLQGIPPKDAEQLVFEISIRHPNNTMIIQKRRNIYPPSVEFVYSCICKCEVSQNVGTSIKRSVSIETLNIETLNEDLVNNLKVEEESFQE